MGAPDESARGDRVRGVLVGAYVVGLGISITVAETALFLLAARTAWRVARGEARIRWVLAWPIAAFIAATVLSASLSARPLESLVSARTVLLLLSLWVVIDALPTIASAARALLALLGVLGAVSLLGIAQTELCTEPWFAHLGASVSAWWPSLGHFFVKCHRAHAFYSIYMTFAGVLDVALLATLSVLVQPELAPRWARPAWLAALIAFALTQVRGAWLGFVAGGVALVGATRRRRLALSAALVLLALVSLLLPGVRGRARSIVDPADPTSSERVLMWKSGLAMARDHPLVGVGPGEVKRVYPSYAAPNVPNRYRGHLHNTPIQMLVERGVLGLATWLWLFGAFFAHAARVARRTHEERARALVTGAIAAIVGFLVAGFFEHNFGDSEVLLVALFVMSLVFVIDRETASA